MLAVLEYKTAIRKQGYFSALANPN